MIIFYTLPPSPIFYPYVLLNASRPDEGLRYVAKYWRDIMGVIIDSGVEIFRKEGVREYPLGSRGWIARMAWLYRQVKALAPNAYVYATCPDYPDDYNPTSLWLSKTITNIERTVENVKICMNEFRDVNWLISIQGWNRRPDSLEMSIKYYYELGVFDRFHYFAIANLCVEPDVDIIYKSVLVVRKALKEIGVLDKAYLHIFGLKIQALKKVRDLIHSFDSTAWTRPVNSRARNIRPASAKTLNERIGFFCEYIRNLFYKYKVDIDPRTIMMCGGV